MKIEQLLGSEMTECQIMVEIQKAMEMGLPEVKLGSVIIKVPIKIISWEQFQD